jgi:hypothetical protein
LPAEDFMELSSRWSFLPAFVVLAAVAGCSGSSALDEAEVERLRTQLTLTEEPDGAETVLDVRSAMLGEEKPDVHALVAPDHEHEGEAEEAEAEEGEAAEAEHVAADDHADEEHADHDHAGHDHAGHDHSGHDHADHDHAEATEVGPRDVVLVGVVGGVTNPSPQIFPDFPFDPDAAVFFLVDPEAVAAAEEHGHQHAPGEECAFCLANAADASTLIAAVRFLDEDGEPLPVDVRTLFDLKEKETVVIRGTATAKTGSILTVDATGLYVRR